MEAAMGADLVAMALKGPKELDKTKIPEAVARACEIAYRLVKVDAEEDDVKRDRMTRELREKYEWYEDSEIVADSLPFGHRSASAERLRDEIVAFVTKCVGDVFELWENGARDAVSRTDPDDPNALWWFAGERTWGDEPDGFGYTTLKWACWLGFADVLGLK